MGTIYRKTSPRSSRREPLARPAAKREEQATKRLVRVERGMSIESENFWDNLSGDEATLMEHILHDVNAQPWAAHLISAINANGGIVQANKALLFELRFAYALYKSGLVPKYEIPGEETSTIDFGFISSGQSWAVELMRLEETEAVRAATHSRTDGDGVAWSKRLLSSRAEDPRQSEEGETLKAVQRICQKCENHGQPYKFPLPDGQLQAILVDFRNFLDGGDGYDRIHVALGGEFLNEMYQRYWKGRLISGVFSTRTSVKGANEARERVHFIGFVNEKSYEPEEFGAAIQFVANPSLFADADEVRRAIDTWPLKDSKLLNGR